MAQAQHLKPEVRKQLILDVAVERAAKLGFDKLRRDDVAEHAEIANGLVTLYFNTMTQLRRAVMRAAVQRKILPIIAHGLVIKHPEALKADEETKQQALASLKV
jgi:AcrR family transcriptional regulator